MEQRCFLSSKNQKKLLLNFHKILPQSYNNGNTKIVNLLNGSDNKNWKFATKELYVIESESKGVYSHENLIKFLTSLLE